MANVEWSAFPSGSQMQVGDQTVGLRSGLNYRFAFPDVGIKDTSGNYLLQWASSGVAAVNYLKTLSSNTGVGVTLSSAGTDASPNLILATQGSGNILFTPGGTGNIQCSTHLILSTSSPAVPLEAASKGYVDSVVIATPVSLANGGTGASLVANNGGIFYSNATTGGILPGTATANQVLVSGSSSAPQWTTATYPFTTTINQLLYSSSANTIAGLATANNGALVTSNAGVPSVLAGPGTTGNIFQSNTAAAPSWSTATYPSTTTINQILYSSSNNTVAGLSTAVSSVLITSAGGIPSLSQTLPSAVQGNITTLGTITSGVWNGTIITGQYGGTGVNNGASLITIGGSFTMSGAFAFTGTLTNTTSVTFPTSGTLATTAQLPTLPLSLANGGTGASLTAANGGIFYSTASAGAILAPTATANQVLMSGSNTTPAWSTAVYPATTTVSQFLYSSSSNVITGLATANSAMIVTNSTGVPAFTASLTNGQVIVGSTGATPTPATLTAGTGITITNGAASITIAGTGGGMSWTDVTGTSQAMAVDNGYIADNAGLVTLTLPSTAALGTIISVAGKGAGGWVIAQNASQQIQLGSVATTAGVSGSVASTNRWDSINLLCVTANLIWVSIGGPQSSGLTIV